MSTTDIQRVNITEIVTSRSAYVAHLKCPRLRWHAYEQPNGTPTTRGWEKRSLAIPPSTGIWCHRLAQGLLLLASGDMRRWWEGIGVEAGFEPTSATGVILGAKIAYLTEVAERGLELGAEGDTTQSWVAQEQAALLEAFGWAFQRVRLPLLLGEYDVVSLEQEERTLLAGDVTLASRADAILRRKEDGKLFVWNLKTGGRVKEANWQAQWQYDTQLLTEPLAVERRLGEKVWGVLIEGFDTGARVDCYEDNDVARAQGYTLKEVRDGTRREDAPIVKCQRTRLLYGYKSDSNPPVQKAMYDYAGTTRKGWYRFATYLNDFSDAEGIDARGSTPVEKWVNWLPDDEVAAQFVSLEPIMRDDRAVEAKVTQIVATERLIQGNSRVVEGHNGSATYLDRLFPQHDGRECLYCPMKDMCHTSGVASDPLGSGLYLPRTDHHEEGGE